MDNLPLDKLPFTLRPMTLADLPAVMAIETVSYSAPWPESAFRQALSDERAYFVLLKHHGHVLGYSGAWNQHDEVHVGTLVSHPAVRRKGIGELLLALMIQRAINQAAETVTLEVRPSNWIARRLYVKYGFMAAGLRKRYYPDTREDAIIMTTPPLVSTAYQARIQRLTTALFERLASFNLDEIPELT